MQAMTARDSFVMTSHPSQQTTAATTLMPLWMRRQPNSICET
jgi:hypothetical protein